MTKLKILVISDIHAITDKSKSKYSHLFLGDSKREYADSIVNYIKGLDQKFDLLVCAGDISNIGDELCFNAGLEFIHRIKEELDIDELLCVPGNHDHKSRPPDNENPKITLENAERPFPTTCPRKNEIFLKSDWCHVSGEELGYNAILLNTSAFHGEGEEDKHGKVGSTTIEEIGEFIQSEEYEDQPLNILVCHHHPLKMEHVDEEVDYESMEGGELLLRRLHEVKGGAWLIIHGHKHFPEITYASAAGRSPPIIFSAGSLSAQIYSKIESRTSNQFYVLEVELDSSLAVGIPVGTFETYERVLSSSWRPSQAKNLPAKGGFGSSENPYQVSLKIKDAITDECPFLEKEELQELTKSTRHFTPSDFDRLVQLLEQSQLSVEVENYSISVVGRPYE